MKKGCIKRNKYRKFRNHEMSNSLGKTLVLSIICDDCGSKDQRIFKDEQSTEIWLMKIEKYK